MEWLSILNTAITAAIALGAFVAFLRSNKSEVSAIQEKTIQALKIRLETVEAKQADLEKDKIRLEQVIDTIQSALTKRGIHITIDGDMVTIDDGKASSSMHRRTTRQHKETN